MQQEERMKLCGVVIAGVIATGKEILSCAKIASAERERETRERSCRVPKLQMHIDH